MSRLVPYDATLVERIDLTDTLAIFRIAPDRPPERPWFSAGQYCVLGLNNAANPPLGGVSRAMSIASAPEAEGPVEFYVRRVSRPVSANPLTPLLWPLTAGDRLHMGVAAAGTFTIHDMIGADDPRVRVLVAAGTGLAPFVSMIRSEVCRNPRADLSKWVLLHGVSYPTELGYHAELVARAETNRLKYWGTVSRPGEANEWRGDVGRVESFFEGGRLNDFERRLCLADGSFVPRTAVVFVCGPTGTLTGTITALIDRGFVPRGERIRRALGVPPSIAESVFIEAYDPTPPIDVNDRPFVDSLRTRMQVALAKLP